MLGKVGSSAMGSRISGLSRGPLDERSIRRGSVGSGLLGEPVPPSGGYLGVLTDQTSRMSLELLAEHGPLAHAAHMRRVCEMRYISVSTFERMYRCLVRGGLVASWAPEDDRRRRVDELTPLAPELLRIAREVEAVERWAPRSVRASGAPSLLKAVADRRGWLIVRELFDRPLCYTELSVRLPQLPEATLSESLGALTNSGLVRVERGPRMGQHCYTLSELVPALARVVVLSARFRRKITPRRAPWLTGELPSFIRLLERAPALRGPREARGAVLLQVVKLPEDERGWPEVEVTLRHGRILAHRLGAAAPRAKARALPLAWCDAELDGNLSGVEIEGDVKLTRTLLGAIAAVVAACPEP